jgi:hypothetical protein
MAFDKWFDENKDELELLLRNDAMEALFLAYMAGMDDMGEFTSRLYSGAPKKKVEITK